MRTEILRVLVGSRAHGLAQPDSDYDYRSVIRYETRDLLALGPKPKERIELFPPGVRGSLQRGIADLGRQLRRRGRQWLARGLAAAVTGGS